MLKFIVDTQLPPSLARFLRLKGFDALHTTDFPNGHLLKDNANNGFKSSKAPNGALFDSDGRNPSTIWMIYYATIFTFSMGFAHRYQITPHSGLLNF